MSEYQKRRQRIEEEAVRFIRWRFPSPLDGLDHPACKMLRVWAYKDAPQELKDLSTNGGDEDWLLLVPPSHDGWIPWAEDGTRFGICCVDEHVLESGWKVLIGSHA